MELVPQGVHRRVCRVDALGVLPEGALAAHAEVAVLDGPVLGAQVVPRAVGDEEVGVLLRLRHEAAHDGALVVLEGGDLAAGAEDDHELEVAHALAVGVLLVVRRGHRERLLEDLRAAVAHGDLDEYDVVLREGGHVVQRHRVGAGQAAVRDVVVEGGGLLDVHRALARDAHLLGGDPGGHKLGDGHREARGDGGGEAGEGAVEGQGVGLDRAVVPRRVPEEEGERPAEEQLVAGEVASARRLAHRCKVLEALVALEDLREGGGTLFDLLGDAGDDLAEERVRVDVAGRGHLGLRVPDEAERLEARDGLEHGFDGFLDAAVEHEENVPEHAVGVVVHVAVDDGDFLEYQQRLAVDLDKERIAEESANELDVALEDVVEVVEALLDELCVGSNELERPPGGVGFALLHDNGALEETDDNEMQNVHGPVAEVLGVE